MQVENKGCPSDRVTAEQEKEEPERLEGTPPPAAGLQGSFHFEGLGRHCALSPSLGTGLGLGVEAEREEMVTGPRWDDVYTRISVQRPEGPG